MPPPAKIISLLMTETDDELRSAFFSLKNRRQVAALLHVSPQQLTYHIFIAPIDRRYKKFQIGKSSGGVRDICAPATALKIIQRKLCQVLQAVYNPRNPVHGFVEKRNVLSNASVHLGAKFVLNIDLENYFPSINFGRVRGTFMAKPYSLPSDVATVLSQICCFENSLPQGAPTSPVVSNMVCARLDAHLQSLATRFNCLYTRYADDITFSTKASVFPAALARNVTTPAGAETVVGTELQRIVASNGFCLNSKKTRLHGRSRRQEVTGVTINEFPNVQRTYLNQVRAMLHAWKKFGLEHAASEFANCYQAKDHNPTSSPPSFSRVIKGKLDFLTLIRGKDDSVSIRLLRQYSKLNPSYRFTATIGPRTNVELAFEAVWVLEALEDEGCELFTEQGTAFFLAGVGLVTCAHVLTPKTMAIRPVEPHKRYPINVIATDSHVDLAVVSVPGIDHEIDLLARKPETLHQSDPVFVLGFPHYCPGNQCAIKEGAITAFQMVSGIRRILVDAHIIAGNSGGPVLDANNRVIGVAAKGAFSEDGAAATSKHEVIPIDALKHLGFAQFGDAVSAVNA
ncbi:MAG TPA: trypsin-like peptidase domain-containing protein [Bryobacteraceae bacterium]|nr:trypsin-like peptidase domain-containing protein [Bryobacteraceae bacterium]